MEISKDTKPGQRRKQFDKNTCNLVIRLYESGLSVRQVMDKTQLSRYVVRTILRNHGVQSMQTGRRPKQFDKSTCNRVIRLYESGLSVRQVVAKTNLSRYDVGCILNRHEVQSHKRGRFLVEVDRRQIDRAVEIYGTGVSMKQVTRETGLNYYYLMREFAKLGIPAHGIDRKFRQIPQQTKDKVIRLYDSGQTMPQVAQKLKLTKFLVRKILIERNYPIRPRGGAVPFDDSPPRPATNPANQPKRKK